MSESVLFTSFAILLALLTKKPPRKLQITKQLTVIIKPTKPVPIHSEPDLQDKKKKGKRNKRTNKNDLNDIIEKISYQKH